MVPADSVRVSRDPTYSGTDRAAFAFAYGTVTRYGLPFQRVRLVAADLVWSALQPREGKPSRFGLFPVRSPLLRKSRFLSFPTVTEMFQFTAFAAAAYGFGSRTSGIPGSVLV